jgi:glycosyltransferase involved in cell wall biosynthesis
MKQFKKGVTVLVCTHNGALNLPDTFACLAKQKAIGVAWEILVVDNASTDNTAEVAQQLAASMGAVPVRVISEPLKGKEQGLYTGLRQASYQYVIVCDDDNWLDENYVGLAFRIMQEHPGVGLLGGRGLPAFDGPPPAWFFQFESFYAVGRQGRHDGMLVSSPGRGAYLWGAGSVINRAAIDLLESCGYRPVLTHADYPRFRCEDLELCLAIQLAGYAIMYDGRLVFRHHITADRLRWSYLMENSRAGGLGAALLQPYVDTLHSPGPRRGAHLVWGFYLVDSAWAVGRHLAAPKGWKFLASLLMRSKGFQGNYDYQVMMVDSYRLYGAWRVRRAFKKLYKRLAVLKEKLAEARLPSYTIDRSQI